ncbi:hypothetical protein PhCBS80983_g01576 [Powellomyces hirtus]|uniref:Structural maintenance of chromosomes protein 5 n=1 Tax=Powellomyces hirtus TaxID=109895 RepID=A0A507EA52_9FUNG|nr:hypothetical protein PhCBS80983_g01576 [Powellomyces hirtus]
MASRRRSRRSIVEEGEDETLQEAPAVEEADIGEEEEGSEHQEEDAPEDEPQTKRRRVNGKATSKETDEEQRFPPGAIVRIRLRNFITYDAVEFRPGPNLNMIIGPNGTGKSSLVCAIALGLGGRPDALGRQKTLQDFIKDGKDKASIEIELKHRGRGGNVIIKRLFKRGEKNSNNWKINGDVVTERVLKERMASMRIQVDNLCSFLPQEKVSEFAQLNPRELLTETQRAAGNSKLTSWHEELIKLREEEKKAEASVADDKKHLENLESRNAVLQRDVARYREREAVLRKIDVLKMKIPWVKYEATRLQWMAARQVKADKRAAYAEIEQRTAPLRQEYETIHEESRQLTQDVNNLSRKYQEKLLSDTGLKGKSDALQAAETENDDLSRQLSGIQKREKEKMKKLEVARADVLKVESAVQTLQTQLVENGTLDDEGGMGGIAGGELTQLQEQIEAKNRELREIGDQAAAFRQQQSEIQDEAGTYRNERERRYNELQGLDNVRNQKLELLRRENKDCYDATMWVKDNQHLFTKKVFEPVCLEINAKNPVYAEALEAYIQRGQMTTFVTQTEQDYHLLSREMIDNKRLRINIVMFSQRTLESWRPDIPRDHIMRLGFDGYLLDYLEGPPEVLSSLCQLSRIHNIPVASQELRNNTDIEQDRRITAYISKKMSYKVRRAYGNTAVTASQLREARFLNASVDMSRKTQLEEELERLHSKIENCAQRSKAISVDEQKLRTQDKRLREEKAVFTDRKKEIQQQKLKYDKLVQELDIKRMRLRNLETEGPSTEEQELQIKKAIKAVNIKRAKLALDYQRIQRQALEVFYARTLASLRQMALAARVQDNEQRMREADAELIQAKAELEAAVEEFDALKVKATAELAAAREMLAGHSDEDRDDYLRMYPNESLEELENILAEQEARAEMINQTDAGVIDDFERRAAEIARLTAKMQGIQNKLAEWKTKIDRVKGKWEPELTALVSRISTSFSAAFEKIGCAGEVKLSLDEDYDKWGIDILVKFRDTEKLHQLTGQRQSGGERSVSTILYLMALQELSHTPFRVVDEINQGMDPRNERMVHGEMVRAACQTGTSQYFLITPKLLPDLEYHEAMRVLCVFNGAYTPETIDPKIYLARRLARCG